MEKKPGRNDPCPCGSGKKYKHCCWGKKEPTKTYTSGGKRKFKATLLSGGDKSQQVFHGSTPQAPSLGDPDALEKLRFRMTGSDYRTEEETPSEETPKSEEAQKPSSPPATPLSTEDDFNPTDTDYTEEKK